MPRTCRLLNQERCRLSSASMARSNAPGLKPRDHFAFPTVVSACSSRQMPTAAGGPGVMHVGKKARMHLT